MSDGDCSALAYLLTRYVPAFKPNVVLDVGANTGVFSEQFRRYFPMTEISAFEPSREAFAELLKRTAGEPLTKIYNVALGDAEGELPFMANGASPMNRIADEKSDIAPSYPVLVRRGEAVCYELRLEHIDYLKVDTEGYDLKVVRGFETLLKTQKIDFVEMEVGFTKLNPLHVPFEAACGYVRGQGYEIFHIFEQFMDLPFSRRPILRRANVVFISDAASEKYMYAIAT